MVNIASFCRVFGVFVDDEGEENYWNTYLVENWTTPVRIKGDQGDKGDTGNIGASPVYQGVYSSTKTYYGTSTRVDIVKYDSNYYVARVDAGTFSNVVPTDTSKWNSFGAQFESVATDLLLAQAAYINNLIVSRLSTSANKYSARLASVSDNLGVFQKLADESNIGNAYVAIGKDVGQMQATGLKKPGIIMRDKNWKGYYSSSTIYYKDDRVYYNGYEWIFVYEWGDTETPQSGITPSSSNYYYWQQIGTYDSTYNTGGSYSEVTSAGVFSNGSNIESLPAVVGVGSNATGAFLLQSRNSDPNGISCAVYAVDQTSSGNSKSYAGFFNGDTLCGGFTFLNKGVAFSETILDNNHTYFYLNRSHFHVTHYGTESNKYIYLPSSSNRYVGQMFMIVRINSFRLYIRGNGATIFKGTGEYDEVEIGDARNTLVLFWCGDRWIANEIPR